LHVTCIKWQGKLTNWRHMPGSGLANRRNMLPTAKGCRCCAVVGPTFISSVAG
jgi:hypothetical protein